MRRNKQLALNFSILRIISKKILFSRKENDFVSVLLCRLKAVFHFIPQHTSTLSTSMLVRGNNPEVICNLPTTLTFTRETLCLYAYALIFAIQF